ncbi:two pore domain potassium channel family protein [Pseudoruegeria sp. HB172150]|uniref:two pore domain potassium channel family protein n=1 Tax=Pseudoruegeria sp. HB172150 TaxID=2721164 RepID=UPI001554316F|nr:two pore domain potassium channel family protein [Pseudoruegeria sp. HB172150]
MFVQILIGGALTMFTTLLGLAAFPIVESIFEREEQHVHDDPRTVRVVLLVATSVLWLTSLMVAACWAWATLLKFLGLFETLEEALYFSMVAFTTLGFGDIVLPEEWNVLSGMMAINGLFMVGLLSATFVDVMRRVRALQLEIRAFRAKRRASKD